MEHLPSSPSNEEQLAIPSEDFQYYIDQYKIKHEEGYTSYLGISPTYNDRERIKAYLEEYKVKTLLDYGIAQGVGYEKGNLAEYWGLESFAGYDPAVERYSQKPVGKFDAVLCYDTLEHIPEGSIDYVLQDIFSYTDGIILLRIDKGPAYALLPNGDNCHLTIQPAAWWEEKIKAHLKPGQTVLVHGKRLTK